MYKRVNILEAFGVFFFYILVMFHQDWLQNILSHWDSRFSSPVTRRACLIESTITGGHSFGEFAPASQPFRRFL